MAGDIHVVDGKRASRRHWTLRGKKNVKIIYFCAFIHMNLFMIIKKDRSAMSVHFLKTNLAEDGCEEAQLDLGKKLLQDSKDPELLESSQS